MDIEELKSKFVNFKDSSFRPGQAEAVKHYYENRKKVTVICAPTGSGKSLIGMVAAALNEKAAYLCSSKQLQYQLERDFPESKYMMGRSNFPCAQDPLNRDASLCIHTSQTPCKLKSKCEYELHKKRVMRHPLQILNYHYFLYEGNYVGKFSDYPLIVCDEADVLESLLTGFVELRISGRKLQDLGISPPRRKTSTAKDGLASWREWAKDEAMAKVTYRIKQINQDLEDVQPGDTLSDQDMWAVKELKSLESLQSKLHIFIENMDDTWIYQENKNNGNTASWSFQPTWLTSNLANKYFWDHSDRFILMSATFPPKHVLAETLGLPTGDISFIELPSVFPVSNRPVYLHPVADMSYKTFDESLPSLLSGIEDVLSKHPHEKGLIHTVSWKLDKQIMKIKDPRLIFHSTLSKDEQLKRFSNSKNAVFVSPSSTRGVDLPDDQCRFQIICKAPFQSLGDKLVSSRVYGGGLGKFWYRAICAQDIVQASGRGVRHAKDHCVVYLLDKQIERLIVDNQQLFPRYWLKAVDYL